MSEHTEHDQDLDSLGLRRESVPDEPPAAFMALVRRRHRRAIAVRIGGTVITGAVMMLVALAIALPLLRTEPSKPVPIVISDPRETSLSIVPTAAAVRRYLDEPSMLDWPDTPGGSAAPVRAGDHPDSPAVRSLLTLN